MSTSAIRRWQAPASSLPDGKPYRPKSLAKAEAELETLTTWSFEAPGDLIDTVVAKSGDTLGAYARKYYGDAQRYPVIYEANRDVLENADDLFAGQTIRIPKLAPVTAVEDGATAL